MKRGVPELFFENVVLSQRFTPERELLLEGCTLS
jgi:hypothetical protein